LGELTVKTTVLPTAALLGVALLVTTALVTDGFSQPSADDTKKSPAASESGTTKKPSKPAPTSSRPLTGQDEQAALRFAQLHHPELHDLVRRLRANNRGEFREAVRQLHVTRERLERLEEKTPERYAPTLALWKLDSRIRLLVARMTMSDDSGLREELDELLAKRTQSRLELLKIDLERAETRAARLRQQIAEIESNPQAAARKDLAAARRSLGLPPDENAPGKNRVKTGPARPEAAGQ
jgi:hypothetical protein